MGVALSEICKLHSKEGPGMGCFAGLVVVLLVTGCSGVPLSWNQLNLVAGVARIRSRWFAGTAFANDMLYVFGGEGSGSTANDSGILGKRILEIECNNDV